MKVVITEECIGCGACEAVAPEYFEVVDGKAKVKNIKGADVDKLNEAKDACPVSAIKIE